MNGEYGVEISDSYVVKRQHENYIDSKLSKEEKQKKKIEIKERRQHKKQQDKENKKAGKPAIYNKVRDLYVVVFSTKNSKNNTVNPPRCIECEVVNTQVSKKDFSRSIHILGERNYEQEMK
ncbi:hypothetical protein FACS189459_1240 [Bacilli bacterium]|nr:hypothetical protein FACS189459_1240 [Bacilli bacterium]